MDVTGVDVFEIGPGDHLSSGLALLAAGARSYTCADRFPGNYSSSDARTWYRMVRSAWPESYPAWPETLNAETFPEGCPGVKILPLGVESLFDVGTFDLVGSTSVGEHVSDITAFAEASHRLLRPGGFAIHHIDFAPHDCWRTDYDDPFIFLRFPEWLWRMMGSNRGIPNRRRFHEFLDAFETAGLSILVRERSLAYQGLPIPRRLKGSPADSVATIAATFVLTIPVRAKS